MKKISLCLTLVWHIISCGQQDTEHEKNPAKSSDDGQARVLKAGEIPYIKKATWSATLKLGQRPESETFNLLNHERSSFVFTVRSTVPRHLRFQIIDEEFRAPTDPHENIVSFGKLTIHSLRDNNLKVCGSGGDEKCNFAAIRIYTDGTGGEGYWNPQEGYGLPILVNGNKVPFKEQNALTLAKQALANIRVLKLSDFNDLNKDIPIDIDFTDAVYGSYQVEIYIDYILF